VDISSARTEGKRPNASMSWCTALVSVPFERGQVWRPPESSRSVRVAAGQPSNRGQRRPVKSSRSRM